MERSMTAKIPKTIAGNTLPPREKIAPRSDKTVDMSTPEAKARVMKTVGAVIRKHDRAIKALAKR
jgi:hypothetical protein